MNDIIEAYQSPWEETIDAYAEDNRRLREKNITLRKQIAELHHEIGASREEIVCLRHDLDIALDKAFEVPRAEENKIRNDTIEECAAFMEKWSDKSSQYASVIRALANTSDDRS